MSTEVGWFRKTKDGEVGAYTKFLNMLRHFTQDDYILRFSFVDEVTNKPFIPRLTRLWNRNNCCAISPCQSGGKNTSGHWKCKASSWNVVTMRESFSNVSNFLIYLYCKRKASEIFIFHFFRRSKMRRGGCSLTHLTHFKATKRFQYTHFSSCHPSVVTKGFIKGKACRPKLLWNSI